MKDLAKVRKRSKVETSEEVILVIKGMEMFTPWKDPRSVIFDYVLI